MREEWDTGAADPEARVNMDAVAARLTAAGINFSPYALWTLSECLEEAPKAGSGGLGAAVPCFQYCASTALTWMLTYAHAADQRKLTSRVFAGHDDNLELEGPVRERLATLEADG